MASDCWRRIGPFLLAMLAAVVAVSGTSLLSDTFLRCKGFTGVRSAVVDQAGLRAPSVTMTRILCMLSLSQYSEQLYGPTTELDVTGCHVHSTFHHRFTVISQNNSITFLKIFGQLIEHLLSLTLPVFFKCWTNIGWSGLSSLAASDVVVSHLP